METATTPRPSIAGWIGALWGLGGVGLLLGFAIYRLTPLGLEAVRSELSTLQWVALVGFTIFMLYSEAWKGFQKAFSPRVAARCRHLRDHATPWRVLLAPFFAMAYFAAPRRRRIASYALTTGVILLVILVQQLDQPWRGIVDVGVVLGLTWGLVATVVYWVLAMTRETFPHDPEVTS